MNQSFSKFRIPRELIEVRTSRSGGSGGQHVNKVETKVEIRFSLETSKWLPEDVKNRLKENFPSKVTKSFDFIVTCDASRSQNQNLEDCFGKLNDMIRSCWKAPKKRIKSKPTRSSKEKRLKSKKLNSDKKKGRSSNRDD